jgi:hypothetical protein
MFFIYKYPTKQKNRRSRERMKKKFIQKAENQLPTSIILTSRPEFFSNHSLNIGFHRDPNKEVN